MAVSAVRICLRKKGKANGPSELEKILLGYYIKLGPGSQELCVYLEIERLRRGKLISWNFRIKPFYPKIGGMCLHQNLERRTREFKGFKNCAHQEINCARIDIS